MTREEKQKAIDALKISAPVMVVTQEEFIDYIQMLNKIMDWLEQEPIPIECDDAVSREMALNSLIDNTHLDGYDLAEALDAIENKEKLPPVTQKLGKWIMHRGYNADGFGIEYACSECNYWNDEKSRYCPNCGAKMQEAKDES